MIKWPNDIVINGKKICGILTEMSAEINMVNYVVCGIGVNVNTESFDDDIADKATSMFIESGHKYVRNELIAKLLNEFEYYYKKFLDGGLSAILDEYKKCCVTLGREVDVYKRQVLQMCLLFPPSIQTLTVLRTVTELICVRLRYLHLKLMRTIRANALYLEIRIWFIFLSMTKTFGRRYIKLYL